MATTSQKIDLSNIHAVIGAIHPELSRSDNQIMQLNGHPCEMFIVKTSGGAATNYNLTSNIIRVLGGVVINVTTGLTLPIAVTPLPTNASVAVVNAVLPDASEFFVIVYGCEI